MPVVTEALPAAIVRPAVAPQPPGVEHMYNLPESTAGQAKTKRRATATATAAAPAVRPRMATQRRHLLPLLRKFDQGAVVGGNEE
ncbi:hypothetical protein N1851_033467 [Merluccius polli]|uniref:Uncharacterized protein n=1 Tax=Merluccius polli TaxID=89951 RepID=A0AA47M1F8_MERPO|nr:hypothetical protein N1851_033467 [Merluccius polli]